jgi:molybdopterin-guanine dinucleotide biosynthesis protein A
MGVAKHSLTLQGRTFLAWCVSALVDEVDEVFVSAGLNHDLPPLDSSVRFTADERLFAGPLSGIAASFRRTTADAIAVVSCDAPMVERRLLQALFETLEDAEAAIALAGGRMQFFPGVYRRSLGSKAERLIEEGTHSVTAFLEDANVRVLKEEQVLAVDPLLASFRNVNTPEDYAAFVREFGGP